MLDEIVYTGADNQCKGELKLTNAAKVAALWRRSINPRTNGVKCGGVLCVREGQKSLKRVKKTTSP